MSTALVRNTLLATCFALPVTACAADPLAPQWDELESAEQLWSDNTPAHYSFTYTELCFCGLAPLDIEVLNGEVVSVEPANPEQQPPPGELVGYTIDELLERVARELRRRPHDARTRFDPSRGYPIEVFFDYEEYTADEEWGFRVESFTVLP